MKHFPENTGTDILMASALLDLMQDLVFLMEKDEESFRCVYANPVTFTVLNLPENLIGSRIEEVIPPTHAQDLIHNYRRAQTSKESVEFIQYMTDENNERLGETILHPLIEKNGECRYILAIVTDVTEREHQKQDLQVTQKDMEIERKRLSSLFENNGNAMFEFDQQMKFLSVNDKVSELIGYSKEELLGQSIVGIVLESYLEATIDCFKKALEGSPTQFETAVYTKTHQKALFRVNTIPIILEDNLIGIYAMAEEITEQKQMENLLRESELRYKSLFDNHPHGIFTFDQNGNLVSGNSGAERITGYTISELLAKSFFSILLPPEIERITALFYQVMNEKQPKSYEMAFRHQNGHLVDLQTMIIPILVNKQIVGIYGIITDITEIKRAQKALIETKEELEVFWENSTDPIFYIDTKGDILKVNPAFETTFEFTENEMVSRKGTIIPRDLIEDQFNIVERLLQGETINSHDTIRITKTGKLLNIISSYSPVRNADKQIIGATIIYKNVTELVKAEKELRKSQEKYKLITESTFDIVTLINLSGQIEYVSPANKKIFGYPDHVYLGKPFTENVHPEDAFEFMKSVTSLLEGRNPNPIEIRFLHQDGHYIWMEVSPTPVLVSGEVKQLFTIARDITERKRLQDKIARMAFYDHLSGIANRRTFDDQLQKAIQQADQTGKKVAILMLDGRKFKQINDRFGHDAGDAVIKEMAMRLEPCIRPIDTAARLGGDEMGVILPELDSIEVAEETAKRILKTFEIPVFFNGHEIKIGAEIGISLYPDNASTEKQLVKSADMALYEAKKSNQNEYQIYTKRFTD